MFGVHVVVGLIPTCGYGMGPTMQITGEFVVSGELLEIPNHLMDQSLRIVTQTSHNAE